ncbi:glycerol-3-phosphate 1-O-acyltransferase PlsB [Wenzhouxiangella marina]|uniref:Glycerol-3-phosphate acyltransferase n=1 Tax=Wenzhouxiangella marina TaxID=1579979 RepID=A0A0K0XSB0_9GAMM|nr:glycerol-3-phosphate 1-O-acyltransferase PlsB [Wenzhouxiangella marina]AKS40545.1 glycerol-3-phosphate acyltransferase [Wenzhouxiangella marina]MBB6088313.1 glycerol-3-phosphate O-acyltransferase [Wenzhouxiangella marina]
MPDTGPAPSLLHRLQLVWLGLLRRILHLWVRSTVLPEHLEELALDPERPVFYVLDAYALSSLLIVDHVCKNLEWPRPTQALHAQGLDLPRAYGANRRYRGLFIRSPEARRHSVMLRRLLQQAAASGQTEVQIVPVTVLIGRAPDTENSLFKILFSENWDLGGRFRRLFTTLINGRATMVQFGKPIEVAQLLAETEHAEQALGRVSRVLRVQFRQVRTAAIGPDRSHRRTLVEKVVQSDSVRQAIEAKARRDQVSIEKAEQAARKYAREIAADYSYNFVRIAEKLLSWFWNRIYRGVKVNHFSKFRDAVGEHEVVYVPCHRSHIDYMLLSWLLYHRGFVPPHIAAGLNLNMPLVGPLLRRGGAFFLRRSFRSQPLYAAVFNQYVSMILSRGVALEYFIEGTRSRTGRLLPPRAGMLSITVRAFLHYRTRPVLFQPVYIGYERLAEGNAYIHELSGRQKKPESLADFKNVINILRKNYGEVTVSFGEPVRLAELLDQHHPDWERLKLEPDSKPTWLPGLVNDLADRIMVNINRAAHVNPINLLATALLASRKHALDEDDLERMIGLLAELVRQTGFSDRVDVTELTPGQIIEYGLELGAIERQSHRLGDIVRTDATNAVLLTYFRNNMAHLLAMSAWIACCFLNFRSVRRRRLNALTRTVYPFLKRELFLPWDQDELEPVIERHIQALIDLGLLRSSGDSLQRAPGGSDEAYYLRLLGNSLIQTFERYFITISVLAKNGSGRLTRQQLEQLCILCAQRISLLHEFEAPEFSDKTLFKQFIDSLTEGGFLDRDEEGRLLFSNLLEQVARDAKLILDKEIRHTIIQAAPEVLELESE